MVELSVSACARHRATHDAALTRVACGGWQGARIRARAGSPVGDARSARIHDDLVTPRSPRLGTRIAGMKRSPAEIVREYSFPGVENVHGVSYDGQHVWFAA